MTNPDARRSREDRAALIAKLRQELNRVLNSLALELHPDVHGAVGIQVLRIFHDLEQLAALRDGPAETPAPQDLLERVRHLLVQEQWELSHAVPPEMKYHSEKAETVRLMLNYLSAVSHPAGAEEPR